MTCVYATFGYIRFATHLLIFYMSMLNNTHLIYLGLFFSVCPGTGLLKNLLFIEVYAFRREVFFNLRYNDKMFNVRRS